MCMQKCCRNRIAKASARWGGAALLMALSLCAAPLCAAERFEFWPGATYDASIPTFRQVLGYDPGDRITPHAGLMRYLEALEKASSKLKLFEYSRSWEGRKLVYAVIGSESNMKRMDEIRSSIQKLADPRKTPAAAAAKLIDGLPAVIWLGYGVHGNEISSPEAALLTAYHLLAARNDALTGRILKDALVLIDPTQNPDGRDRFVANFEQSSGLEPDASPLAAEHNEPWPGGRGNHYLFDLNRDWLVATQPETQGRMKALQHWYPLVFVDLHEMGSDSTYYFAPAADPYNPHLTKQQREGLQLFGRNNAKWFDQYGFDYFTREVYDAFYPGYGDSWPDFYGSIGMTYEQASVRGLTVRRTDETTLRYRDTVRHHFVASLSTAETAARHREKLLKDFYDYRRTAIEEGSAEPVKEYILPPGRNSSATQKLAGVLAEQGVEVKRATAPFRADDRDYPAGSYVVSLAQPAKRLIRTLLDPVTSMDEPFTKEQERRRKRKLPYEMYDVTAWSLPLLFNVEAVARPEISQGKFEIAKPVRFLPGQMKGEKASVAYLVQWGSTAAGRLLAAALRQDLRVLSADKAFTINTTKFPSGSLIFKVGDNPLDLGERLRALAASTGADVFPTDTSWVEEGINFGSRYVVHLRKPSIALAWDAPGSPLSAGWARFVLERQFGYPVTPIRTPQLATSDLSRFQVLILPDQAQGRTYTQILGPAGAQHLKEWVSAGGTLLAIANAIPFVADPKIGLLAVSQETAVREPEPAKKSAATTEPATPDSAAAGTAGTEGAVAGKILATDADYNKAIQADKELPDPSPGVLLRAKVDPEYWVTAGMGDTVYALLQGRDIFTPIALNKGFNAAVFESADRILGSGYLWEENRKQLAHKPLVVVQPQGRGVVVGFTADPNYRAYLDGMNILFLNAVFRGPAHARPMTSEE